MTGASSRRRGHAAEKVLALDLSLTVSGYALYLDGFTDVGTIRTAGLRGPERLANVRDRVLDLADMADLVAIEGYAYARANQAHQIGELGGVVRCALWDAGIDYVDVSPATVKKYATGKGNASKDQVLVEAVRRLGYDGSDNNEADAWWLLAAVVEAIGSFPLVEVPKAHRDALGPLFETFTGAA